MNNISLIIKKEYKCVFKLLLSFVGSYFLLMNFRIQINSTMIVAATLMIFILLSFSLPKKISIEILVFAILLAIANNLGSHIVIDKHPYSDLLDKSFISPYDWKDIVGIPFCTVILYYAIYFFVRKAYCITSYIKNKQLEVKEINFFIPMLIMLICWVPYLIIYYPGFIFGDSVSSILQALGKIPLNNHHPVLYTLFLKLCVKIGFFFGSLSFGCAIYSFLQMTFVSFSLAKLIQWLSKHGCPFIILLFLLGIYSIMPFFAQISVAMWKDPIFGASMVLLTLSLLDYYETVIISHKKFTRKNLFYIILSSFLVCFSRNNGVYVILFSWLVILLIAIYDQRKNFNKYLCVILPVFLLISSYFIIIGPVYKTFKVAPTEKVESVGLFLNQMARIAAIPNGVISDNDKAFMNNMLPLSKYREIYRPCVVDRLKWDKDFNMGFINGHMKDFFKSYISIGVKNPIEYIKGWALMTFGYWAPNRWELYNDGGNLARGDFSVLPKSGLPIKQADFYHLPNHWQYILFPIDATVIPLGIIDWIILFSFLLIFLSKDKKSIIVLAPSLGVILTLMIASPYWYWQRYGMAQYYLIPIYIFFIIRYLDILGKEK